MTSAIIETGGKQYRVIPGQLVRVEKLDAQVGSTVTFDRVLAVSVDGKLELGTPHLSQVVTAEVVEQGKGEKIYVRTYKSKKRQRRTLGHRQSLTTVRIAGIGAEKKEAKAAASAEKPAAKQKATKAKATK